MSSASPVPDLVRAARAGRQDAWNALVDRYTPLLLSVVRRYRLQGSDAQDVVQTTWLRLVEHLDDLRVPEALPGWIAATTRNECIRILRSGGRSSLVDPGEDALDRDQPPTPSFEETVLDAMERAERQEVLLAALAELPERQRELLTVLVQDPPLSYAEVSLRLEIPIGSIGPTRARALQRIREHPAVAAWMATHTPSDADRALVRPR